MALAPALKTWLLVVPAVALLGIAGLRAGAHLHVGAADSPAPAALSSEVPAPDAAPASPLLERSRVRERSTAVPSGLPLDLRADLEGDTDLFAYAQRLRLQADGGNVEARWILSRVYDHCSQYAMDPGGYALDNQVLTGMGDATTQAMAGARERVAARCSGFVASDGLGYQTVTRERLQAAREGSLAAEAALLADGRPLQDGEAYRRLLVDRVMASRDPEAYMALAPAMGLRAAGDRALAGRVAGDAMAEVAWRVAACRLGMACGPDSLLMNNYCANAGICTQDAGQDFTDFVYDAAVSRQGAGRMNEWVEQLIGERKSR